MQLFTVRYAGRPDPSRSTSATLQAPQSPSPQPHLLPVRPVERSHSSREVVGETPETVTCWPLRTKLREEVGEFTC